jgi:DNA modification methylase
MHPSQNNKNPEKNGQTTIEEIINKKEKKPDLGVTEKYTKNWGLELYQSDPDIYDKELSAKHPAKAAHFLMVKIFDHCVKNGWLHPFKGPILDPFGGTGRTAIVGNLYGFNSVCVEIEPEFYNNVLPGIIKLAKTKLSTRWPSDPIIIQGDARKIPISNETFQGIITSPPYADQIHQKSNDATLRALGKQGHENCVQAILTGYGNTQGQIGSLKLAAHKTKKEKESYDDAMKEVYQEAYRLLQPGGILVTITKDGVKEGVRQKIGVINKKAAIAAGFKLIDLKFAEVAKPIKENPDLFGHTESPRLQGRISYFRRWHYKKNPNSLIRYEHILFFQK